MIMESTDAWMLAYLKGLLPPEYWHFLLNHLLHPQSAAQVFKRQAVANTYKLVDAMQPIIEPVVNRITSALSASPDIVVLAVCLAAIYITVQTLNWMRRIMLFWAKVAVKAAFWATVAALVALMWQRGAEASLRDAVVIGSKLLGYAAAVKNIWLHEYREWEAQAQARA